MQQKENYLDQLNDSRWRKKRSQIIKRDSYKCTNCSSVESLNVHHKYYVVGKRAWEYPNNVLTTLCNKCHNKWHNENVIEVREKIWCKNREYKLNKKKVRKKKVKSVERLVDIVERRRYTSYTGHKLSEKQANKLRVRDSIKELMLKEVYPDSWKEEFEKTRSLTVDELKRYLS